MEQYHPEAMQLFQILADPLRWQLLTALARSYQHVEDLVEVTGEPRGIILRHLLQLQELGLVAMRQSDADSAVSYYFLDVERMRALYLAAGASLHPALIANEVAQPPIVTARVLFLCTHNSARSQIAEGLVRHYSHGQIDVWSAGSAPTHVHPLAIQVLADVGIDISQHQTHHVNDYLGERFHYVVTVCDEVREVCPSFPGDAQHMHWSFPDPTRHAFLSEPEQALVFRHTMIHMATMVRYFLYFIEREWKHHA